MKSATLLNYDYFSNDIKMFAYFDKKEIEI